MLRESKIMMGIATGISFVFTCFWLLIVYLNWDLLTIDFAMASADFNEWPWFRGSCALSALTFLFPFFAHWSCKGNYRAFVGEIAAYGLGLVWFPILMMYPGIKALGVSSDEKLIWAIFPIVLVQYVCARQIGKEIHRNEVNEFDEIA